MRALLQAAISITLLFMGYGVEGILIGTLSVAVLYVPVCAYIYRVIARELRFPHMKKLLFSVRKRDTGTYFKQGLWIAADRQISRNLYPNIFLLILNATTSLETVGLFRLALRLGSLPAEMITPNITRLSAVAIPKVAAENVIRLKEASLKLMKGTMGLIGLAVLVCAFVVPPLIPVVYGTAFTAAALPFLVILPFNIISAFSVATVPVARVFKKVWMLTVSNASGIIVGSAAFFILRDAITPLVAMGAAILAYHLNSVVLAVILWRFILRQHTELRSVRG